MNVQLDDGPLPLRMIEPPSSTRGDNAIDLSGDADSTPGARGRSERAAKLAAEAGRKTQRVEALQAAERAAAQTLKADKADTLKRKQAAERQTAARKAQALGSGKVARSPPCVAYVMPVQCLICNAGFFFQLARSL